MLDKGDRRVRRTRQALGQALISLIAEKGYDTVTVEEVVERADVGRTTFYLHYKDKDELLLEVTGDVAGDLENQFSQCLDSKEGCLYDVVAMMFRLAGENIKMYRIIMNGQCGPRVLQQFKEKLTGLFQRIVEAQAEQRRAPLEVPSDLVAHYLFGSLQAAITWWLDNDKPYTSQDMERMFHQISSLAATL
jgi:AcrR family transcriptional regulator